MDCIYTKHDWLDSQFLQELRVSQSKLANQESVGNVEASFWETLYCFFRPEFKMVLAILKQIVIVKVKLPDAMPMVSIINFRYYFSCVSPFVAPVYQPTCAVGAISCTTVGSQNIAKLLL